MSIPQADSGGYSGICANPQNLYQLRWQAPPTTPHHTAKERQQATGPIVYDLSRKYGGLVGILKVFLNVERMIIASVLGFCRDALSPMPANSRLVRSRVSFTTC